MPAEAAPAPGPPPARAAHRALAVLTLINLFNYLDRFIVAALVESLRHSELAPTDVELGLLGTSFILVYMITSPVFGALGDRMRRNRLIAVGVAIWSVATAIGGLAHSVLFLLAARSLVGVGEAAYGTIAPALIADYYPKSQRGRAFAVFFCAIPVGSALGYILGGLVDHAFGWRAAFLIAGIPGIALSLLTLKLPDPPRGAQDEPDARAIGPRTLVQTYSDLVRNGAYALTVLGYAAYTFALGGLAFWMPAFLERARGVPRAQATVTFGAIVVATGFAGTFLGGWLGDFGLRFSRQSYLIVSAAATLLAVPASMVALGARDPGTYLPAIVVAEVLLFISTGPINSAIVNLVSPWERASAVALSIFAIHILGDVPSPPLIGAISERSSLEAGLRIVPVAIALAGLLWAIGAWRGWRLGDGGSGRRQDHPGASEPAQDPLP